MNQILQPILELGDTHVDQAVQAIKRNILSGALPPGAKLPINGLSDQLGFSAGQLREAMSKLIAAGLVLPRGKKGFQVVTLSMEDLEDIQRTRHLVEVEALRLSIEKGDIQWESRIVAALHQIKRFSSYAYRPIPKDDLLYDANHSHDALFDAAHREFHTALISACGAKRLLGMNNDLYDQVYRYRIVLRFNPRSATASNEDHENLAHLVLQRQTDAALAALRAHIDETMKKTLGIPKETLDRAFAGQLNQQAYQ